MSPTPNRGTNSGRGARRGSGRAASEDAVRGMMMPGQHAARLMVSQTERVAHFQLDTARRYTDLILGQFQALTEVRDPGSFRHFLEQQRDTLRQFNEAFTNDIQALTDLGRAFNEDLEQVGEEQAKATQEMTQQVESAAEQTAREATRTAESTANRASAAAESASEEGKSDRSKSSSNENRGGKSQSRAS